MIYVNDKQQSLKDFQSPVGKEYKKAMDYFNGLGWPIRFKVKPSILARNEDENGHVYMVMPTYFIHHTALVNTEYGTELWRYTPVPPYEKDGILNWPQEGQNVAYRKKSVTFEKNQADLAFFLWFKSKIFKTIYDIDDAKSEATNRVQAEMDAMKLKMLFYAEDALLRNDEEKLATVARAYNVPRVDTMTNEQRLVALFKVVEGLIIKKSLKLDDFIESLSLDILTELSANIQEAHDKNNILFDEKQHSWFYVNREGNVGDRIVQVPISKIDSKYHYLRDYLKGNQKFLDEFNAHVKDNTRNIITIDFDNLENLSWMDEVVPYIQSVGIKGTGAGRGKEVVFAEIREKCQ